MPMNPSMLEKGPLIPRLRQFDFTGSILIIASNMTLIMAIAFGGVIYAWNSSRVIGLFCGSGVLFILLATQQSLCFLTDRKHRLLPMDLFKSTEVVLLLALTVLGMTTLLWPIYFLPLFYQFARNDDAVAAGKRKLPHIASVIVGLMVSSTQYKKFPFKGPWFYSGTAIVLIGSGLMTMISPSISNAKTYGFTVIMGLGTGFFTQLVYPVAQESNPKRIADVTALLAVAQSIAISVSLVVGTSIFSNLAAQRIGQVLPDLSQSSINSMVAGTDSGLLRSFDEETQGKVIAAIVKTLRDDFIMVAAVSGLAVILSLGIRLRKPIAPTNKPTKESA